MTTPPTPFVADTAAPRAPLVVGAALILAAGAVGSWLTWRAAAAAAAASVERALDAAPHLYRASLVRERVGLRALGRALSGDTRIRSTLALATTDEATVRDILQDLRNETGVDLVAVLDGGKVVRAAVGAPAMVGVNLGTSTVIASADADGAPTLNLWRSERGAAVVAAAQVAMGPDVGGYVVVGRSPPADALTAIAGPLGLRAALLIDGQPADATAPTSAAWQRRDELATAPAIATVWAAQDPPPLPRSALAAIASPIAVACIAAALVIALSSSRRPARP